MKPIVSIFVKKRLRIDRYKSRVPLRAKKTRNKEIKEYRKKEIDLKHKSLHKEERSVL